jgi:glycosyltransferase involved in cell wall biosynthesis
VRRSLRRRPDAPETASRKAEYKQSILRSRRELPMELLIALAERPRLASFMAGRGGDPGALARFLRTARDDTSVPAPAWPLGDFPPFAFADGDTVLQVGCGWGHGGLEALGALRRQMTLTMLGLVHDVVPLLYPEFQVETVTAPFPAYVERMALFCDRIACVSAATRDGFAAAVAAAGLPCPPLFTIRLGDSLDPALAPMAPRALAALEPRPFVLCVGTLEPRKNHELTYRLWRRLAAGRPDLPRLVWAGRQGWNAGHLVRMATADPAFSPDRLLWLDGVSDAELAWLYRHALFTLYPSHYEGWGLPIVEALSAGKVCVASDAPACLEAGGGLAIHHDPIDGPGWYAGIERLLDDEPFRRAAEARIRAEFRPTRWADAMAALMRGWGLEPAPPNGLPR